MRPPYGAAAVPPPPASPCTPAAVAAAESASQPDAPAPLAAGGAAASDTGVSGAPPIPGCGGGAPARPPAAAAACLPAGSGRLSPAVGCFAKARAEALPAASPVIPADAAGGPLGAIGQCRHGRRFSRRRRPCRQASADCRSRPLGGRRLGHHRLLGRALFLALHGSCCHGRRRCDRRESNDSRRAVPAKPWFSANGFSGGVGAHNEIVALPDHCCVLVLLRMFVLRLWFCGPDADHGPLWVSQKVTRR